MRTFFLLVATVAITGASLASAGDVQNENREDPFFRATFSAEHPHILWNGAAVNGGIQGRADFFLDLPSILYANIEVRTRWDKDFSDRGIDKWITWTVGCRGEFAGIEFDCGVSYLDSDDFFATSTDDTRQIPLSDILRPHIEVAHSFRPTERQVVRPFINFGAYLPLEEGVDHGFITNLAVDYTLAFKHFSFEARIGAMNDTGAFGFGEGWLARARVGTYAKIWRMSLGPVVEVISPLSISDITTEVPVPDDVRALAQRVGVFVPRTVSRTIEDPRNIRGTEYAIKAEFRIEF